MYIRNLGTLLLVSAAALTTAACGGGGGEKVAFIPQPPTTAPPTTPPPTSAPTTPVPPFGLTSNQQFVTFGVTAADASQYVVQPADPNAIKFSWSASDKAYDIAVPGLAPARLSLTFPGNNPVAFTGTDANGNKLPVAFSIWYPPTFGGLNYSYSSLAFYSTYPEKATTPFVWAQFAWGVPTLVGDVPRIGTANYDAQVFGVTINQDGYDIRGNARLTFDFGAGALSGYLQPRLFSDWDGVDRSLGQYDFKQTVYSAGSTTFSGKFVVPGTAAESAFRGQFTGPNAAELIAGFQAPYLDPFDNTWKTMGGAWIGKKQ